MLIIMPALGHINIPTDPEKRASLLGLHDKPYVAKQLLHFMLDVLLLPYGYGRYECHIIVVLAFNICY